MTDPPDIDALARRFLDLWQEQVSAAAADPATADMVQRLAQAGAAAPAAWLAWWTQATAKPQHGGAHDDPGGDIRAQAHGAAAARPAPGDRGGDLARLVERVDGLERRIAELEREAAAGPRRAARGGARKRRS